jgi:hypothetical protein
MDGANVFCAKLSKNLIETQIIGFDTLILKKNIVLFIALLIAKCNALVTGIQVSWYIDEKKFNRINKVDNTWIVG